MDLKQLYISEFWWNIIKSCCGFYSAKIGNFLICLTFLQRRLRKMKFSMFSLKYFVFILKLWYNCNIFPIPFLPPNCPIAFHIHSCFFSVFFVSWIEVYVYKFIFLNILSQSVNVICKYMALGMTSWHWITNWHAISWGRFSPSLRVP